MAATMMTSIPQFSGLRPTVSVAPVRSLVAVQPMRRRGGGGGALNARCADFIGSPTNLTNNAFTRGKTDNGGIDKPDAIRWTVRIGSIGESTAGLKLEVRDSGLQTGDPAGFTLADTLACGTVGHIIGVGVVLGLKGIGSL